MADYIDEQVRAKDKWINELLSENEILKNKLEKIKSIAMNIPEIQDIINKD